MSGLLQWGGRGPGGNNVILDLQSGLHILCACDTIMIPFTTRTWDSGVGCHGIIVSALSPNPFFFYSFRDFVSFPLGIWTRAWQLHLEHFMLLNYFKAIHFVLFCNLFNSIPKLTPHMSVEPKWCFLNWSKGRTGIFIPVMISHIRGYVTPNQIHLLFGIFVKKCAQNTQNKAFRGLIWFGLVW